MAFSKARRLSDFIASDGTIPTGKFASSTITSSHLVDGTVAHADLHTNMDLTGKTVLVANASTGDNDTTAANTAFVQQEIAALVDSSPSALNTLNELAAALGDDANFSTTVNNNIAAKLPLAGGTMTGALVVQGGNTNNTSAANTISATGSQHLKIVGSTSSSSGHRATLELTSNSNTLSLSTTGTNSYLTNPVGTFNLQIATDKVVSFAPTIGEIGNVTGFQATNTAGSANTDFGIRATSIRFATGSSEKVRVASTGHLEFNPINSFSGVNNSILSSSNTYMYVMGGAAGLYLGDNEDIENAIGIRNAGYIDFMTGGTGEKMRLTSGGILDIGKASFSSYPTGGKLNVYGDGEGIRLDGTANTTRRIRFRNAGAGTGPGEIVADGSLIIKNEDANAYLNLSSVRNIEYQVTSTNSTAGHHIFTSYGTEIMRIDGANNRVGIGTNNPQKILHVSGGASASTTARFGQSFDTYVEIGPVTATASGMLNFLNSSGTSKWSLGYRDSGAGTDGIFRIRRGATLDTSGPYFQIGTDGGTYIESSSSVAPVNNSAAALTIGNNVNANPSHAVLSFNSGLGRLGVIEGQQRAGGSNPYGHISIITNAGASGAGAMVRSITANYTGKVGVGKGHNITPDMNLEVYAYNETSQWTSSSGSHGGTQAFGILSNSPPAPVAGDYGYYKDFWYYMSGNSNHTMVWDNADSYFNAEVMLVAACTNGGNHNNIFCRGFWSNNHTAHRFDGIEGFRTASSTSTFETTQNSAGAGGIGGLTNGDYFDFTAGAGTNASNSGKLTIYHNYPGASFYGAKIRVRVFFGQFNGHSCSTS